MRGRAGPRSTPRCARDRGRRCRPATSPCSARPTAATANGPNVRSAHGHCSSHLWRQERAHRPAPRRRFGSGSVPSGRIGHKAVAVGKCFFAPTRLGASYGVRFCFRPIADVPEMEQHPPMVPALLLLLLASSTTSAHRRPVVPETAQAWLGFSGATLAIRSVDDPRRRGTAHRRLILTLPSGARRTLPLQDGGGYAGNNSLSLYHVGQDEFFLISERDCVAIDPIRGVLRQCARVGACARRRTYLGRFGWMNGFDPPRGAFGYRFRFLPAYDALPNGGC